MTITCSKNTKFLIAGPGTDVAVATKVTKYLIIDTGTVVDPGEAPVIRRDTRWTATLARRP